MKNKFTSKLFLSVMLSAVLLASTWQGGVPSAEATVITKKIFPQDKGEFFDNWIIFPTTSTDKAEVVSDGSDESGISRTANAKRQTYDMDKNQIPSTAEITNVKIVARAKSGLAGDNIQLTVVKGTTASKISDGPLIPVGSSFGLVTRDLGTTDPFTGLTLTAAQINGMTSGGNEIEFGVNNQQQQNSVLKVSEFYLEVSYLRPNAVITAGSPSPTDPTWGVDTVTVSGTVTGFISGDTVRVDWGSQTTTVDIVDGAWTASYIYEKDAVLNNSHIIVAIVIDSEGQVVSDSATAGAVTVQKQTSTLELDDRIAPGAGSIFTLLGTLVGEDGNGVEDGLVTFAGNGTETSNPLEDAVSGGLTFTSNVIVDSSPDLDNILRLKVGDTITLPPNTVNVRITTKDMGDDQIKFQIYDAAGIDAGTKIFIGSSGAALEDYVQRGAGISELNVLDILDDDGVTSVVGGLGGISKIKAANPLGKTLADVDFPDEISPAVPSLSFNQGFISSLGNAPDIVSCSVDPCINWGVTGNFVGNNYYTGDDDTIFYQTVDVAAGFGGAIPIVADSGNTSARAACYPLTDSDGGSGSGGTGTATVGAGGAITSITITSGGSGYTSGTSYNIIPLTGDGSGATGTVTSSSGVITSIAITVGGTGYTGGQDVAIIPLGGDRICDIWETDGIPYSGGTYDLPDADPAVKDIWVEIDYMEGFPPNVDSLNDVVAAFARHGVNLHYEIDEIVPPIESLQIWTDSDGLLNDFDSYKSQYFGTSTERFLGPEVLTAKGQAYRYFLWVDRLGVGSGGTGTVTTSSGVITSIAITSGGSGYTAGEAVNIIPLDATGSGGTGTATVGAGGAITSITITFGGSGYTTGEAVKFRPVNSGSTGVAEAMGNDGAVAIGGVANTRNMQAGTFMHELGHLLNLNHGGPNNLLGAARTPALSQASVNCKPNYESVMSYSRQYDSKLTGAAWILDFSIGRYNTLKEQALEAALTLSGVTTATVPIVWGTPSAGVGTFQTTTSPLAAIDWNGPTIAGTGAGTNLDVNNFNMYGCPASVANAFTPLMKDYDDWANVDYAFMDLANGYYDGAPGGELYTEVPPEATSDSVLQGQIDNINFVALVPPPDEFGNGQVKSKSNVPIKADAVTNDGQEIVGATLYVTIYSAASNTTPYGTFAMPYRDSSQLYQYDWKSPAVTQNTEVCFEVYIVRPGTPPTDILLLPDNLITCSFNNKSVTNKVILTP